MIQKTFFLPQWIYQISKLQRRKLSILPNATTTCSPQRVLKMEQNFSLLAQQTSSLPPPQNVVQPGSCRFFFWIFIFLLLFFFPFLFLFPSQLSPNKTPLVCLFLFDVDSPPQICHALRTQGSMDFDEITCVVPWDEGALECGQDLDVEQVFFLHSYPNFGYFQKTIFSE